MEKGWDIAQDRIVGKLVPLDKRFRLVLLSACTNIISVGWFVCLVLVCFFKCGM